MRAIQMRKILDVLDREGPLTNVKIAEISKVPRGTVRCYTSILSRNGLLRKYRGMRGIYEITEKGRKVLEESI